MVKIKDDPYGHVYAKFNADSSLDGLNLKFKLWVASKFVFWRYQTMFVKEPDTIDWIMSFRPDEKFLDVGANIGLYSIFAFLARGVEVVALEPEGLNYGVLSRNLGLNEVGDRVLGYPVAAFDSGFCVSRLMISRHDWGGSFNDFREPSRGNSRAVFTQGAIGVSIDELLSSIGTTDIAHVKIDVDGHEEKVVSGMARLLESGSLKTILFEADPNVESNRRALRGLLKAGWNYNLDQLRFKREGLRESAVVEKEIVAQKFFGNVILAKNLIDLSFASEAVERLSAGERRAVEI